MTDSQDDELSRRAAAFARDATRVVRESGVPRHREQALAELMMAEMSAEFENALRRLADTIGAEPERYGAQDRREMLRAALAAAGERVRATVQEQIVAWSAEDPESSAREPDSS